MAEKLPLCGAKKSDGSTCKNPAGKGTDHLGIGPCNRHGGSTTAHKVHARRIEAKMEVDKARSDYIAMGVPLEVDPAQALLEMVYIARGEVAFSSERIAELQPDEILAAPETRTVRSEQGGHQGDVTGREIRHDPAGLHMWIEVRRSAMEQVSRFSKMALDARIDERKVRLNEFHAALLAQAMHGLLREAGLQDNPEAPKWVRRQLTLVAGQVNVGEPGPLPT